ncbi:hypothetical protein OUZ56_027599 [Daphnia magna]|uniref:Uncharacterized protein n=1 Tax=Daphnia magna TaxID=35525 RepID=A0ABR0B1C9_9CRUS|nr:hypothetical protein OUZ56_027599 [Daphnia magna]
MNGCTFRSQCQRIFVKAAKKTNCFLLSGEEEFTTKLRFTFETEKKVMLLNFDPSRPEGVVAFQPSQL